MTEYALEINGLKKVYDNDVEALKLSLIHI